MRLRWRLALSLPHRVDSDCAHTASRRWTDNGQLIDTDHIVADSLRIVYMTIFWAFCSWRSCSSLQLDRFDDSQYFSIEWHSGSFNPIHFTFYLRISQADRLEWLRVNLAPLVFRSAKFKVRMLRIKSSQDAKIRSGAVDECDVVHKLIAGAVYGQCRGREGWRGDNLESKRVIKWRWDGT